MKTFKTILCPIDFSEFSQTALRYAVAMAKENEARLILYHSVLDFNHAIAYMEFPFPGPSPEELLRMARNRLDHFAEKIIPPQLNVTRIVQTGIPAEGILETAAKEKVDLIVMGTHGRTGYERFFLGSITGKILHKALIPVLTVCRPTHHFIPEDGFRPISIKRILCALDLERESEGVSNLALSLARLYQSELMLLHVAQKNEGTDWFERESAGLQKMKTLVNPQQDWCNVRYLVEAGTPQEEILKSAERYGIDLLVIGHHTHFPVREAVVGSVALRTIAGSVCPVLVLRS